MRCHPRSRHAAASHRHYRPHIETLEDRLAPAVLPAGFVETAVASGITAATAMDLSPDGRVFVAEQGGKLRVFAGGALVQDNFFRDTPLAVDANGERGLLGITFDPNYAANHFVYVYYTATTPATHNRVSRFTANAAGTLALPGSEVAILDLENLSTLNHNGGAIHFGPDGRLFVGVGENTNPANSQSLATRLGKLLRINADGSIPADNPFVGVPGARGEIWALGLRNPFTFAFDPLNGRLFINDVGQSAFEEINDGLRGANYGWPATEGPTANPAFVSPLFAYDHSQGCAITGGAFYDPAVQQFPAEFRGKYFYADLCNGYIRRFDPVTRTVVDFATGIGGPVDLKVGPDGSLYYLAQGTGQVFRVRFVGLPLPNAAPSIFVTGADAGGGPQVNIYNAATGALTASFFALPPSFSGGVRVAVGDVNRDGTPDIVAGAGPGGGPQVTVFDGRTLAVIRSFFALPAGFSGGVFVAAGDVNGDRAADIIVGADAGGGPQVSVFDGFTGTPLSSFFAFAPSFTGGVRVAAGDVNGDGRADILCAAGPGGGPQVTIFDGLSLAPLASFFALSPGFAGGVFVAAGDVNGDGRADIIAGAGPGGGPQVSVFDGATQAPLASFFALPPDFTGGVRVALADRAGDGRAEILAAAGPGGAPQVGIFDSTTLAALGSFFAYDPSFGGGVFVAGS